MSIVYHLLVEYSRYLLHCCGKGILGCSIKQNSIVLSIKREYLGPISTFLRGHTHTQFRTLLDLVVVDYPLRRDRFELTYVFLSTIRNTRLFLKTSMSTLSSIQSLSTQYASALWFEREAWDLFGVYFKNNLDLRRLLTDYGFEGHPFRKDFPLSGYVELRYDENQKRIVSEFIEISQEYRSFDFL